MRFQLNEVLPVIHISFDASQHFDCLFAAYLPWRGHKVAAIRFDHLTVAEHHRVRSDYDAETEEPRYDGYVLKSGDDVWHNQYPTAEYGQVSDAGDRMFTRHVVGGWEAWLTANPGKPMETRLLSDYLADLKRGIWKREQEAKRDPKSYTIKDELETEALNLHLDLVVAEYEKQHGKKIGFTKHMIGSDWLEGWWNVSYV
jgi:hypothetical protein